MPRVWASSPRACGRRADSTVEFVTPDLALVQVTWALKGDRNPDGTKREPRDGVFTWVVVKKDGDWLIRA
jgi:hypothetical protein